ncbi:COX4-domain-containing protein [Serendipita vermifera]|nr:COX4-domain-containing protein [Serendipita vermifera]
MQALRRAGCSSLPLTLRASTTSTSTATRLTAATFSTTSSNSDHHSAPANTVVGGKGSSGVLTGDSIIPLSNIQAQWESMTEQEQNLVHRQLEELQTKDWRSLSLDEKRAAYFVSFGAHGARMPSSKPGDGNKIIGGVAGLLAATGLLWVIVRSYGGEPPKTMTKEWQQASNEKAHEQKQNPLTGITAEGYKGKGHVQSK